MPNPRVAAHVETFDSEGCCRSARWVFASYGYPGRLRRKGTAYSLRE